jgi:prepilin-type N-terminal cleavage/methylation domain-containing protein/prepilin-type processing-associated H-X9-DG protein
MHNKPRRRAFTLIELLVVIAIIAILAAILFPVFAQAKVAAKKAVDLSNEKELGLASIMYTNDYDDDYPIDTTYTHAPYDDASFMTWRELIYPYIKNGQASGTLANRNSDTPFVYGGIFETPAAPNWGRTYEAHARIFPTGDGGSWGGGNTPPVLLPSVSTTQLRHPAETLMITTQGVQTDNKRGIYTVESSNGIYDATWTYDYKGVAGAEGVTWADWDVDEAGDWYTNIVPRWRYNGTANIVWCDGHAKTVSKPAFNWCKMMVLPEVGTDGVNQNVSDIFSPGQFCAAYPQYQ